MADVFQGVDPNLSGTYEQALGIANQYSQRYRNRQLTPQEISGYTTKYGGGPGQTVTGKGLNPILQDIYNTRGSSTPAPPTGNVANDVFMNGKPAGAAKPPAGSTVNIPGPPSPYVPQPPNPDPMVSATRQSSSSLMAPSKLTIYPEIDREPRDVPAPPPPAPPPPAGAPPPTAAGTPPAGGNLQDPGYVQSFIAYWANQPGANPSLRNDPDYWLRQIMSGHLGSDEKYIISKFLLPEGAPAGPSLSGGVGRGRSAPSMAPFGGGSYEQALAYVQNYAQQVLGHPLSSADIQGFLTKYGGGPGNNVSAGGLAPVLADISQMGGVGNGGASGVPIDPNAAYPGNLFNDPGTQLLEDTIKARLNELFAPTNDPALQQLQQMIAARIADLKKPVYSDGQEAVIHSKVFDNLEHDRQSEIQSTIERLAGLGHGSGSGTIAQAVGDTNRRFDTTRAHSQNDLALAAIDAAQQRADQAVQLAGTNYNLSSGVQDQETARRREALSLVSTLADIPGQRLQLAEQAAGMSVNPASISDQILRLMTNSQQQSESAANRRSNLVTGIGQIVGSILAGQLRRQQQSAGVDIGGG